MMDSALIVVAKEPVPGLTKTRLCPPFSPGQAADFYRCLMLDTLALAGRLHVVEANERMEADERSAKHQARRGERIVEAEVIDERPR